MVGHVRKQRMGTGMRLCIAVSSLCVLLVVVFVGCPEPPPPVSEKTTLPDGTTIWRGDGAPFEQEPDTAVDPDLEAPSLLTLTQVVLDKSIPLQSVAFIGDTGAAVGAGLFSSENRGGTWSNTSPGAWKGTLYDIAISPNRKKMLSVGGNLQAPQNGLLLLSEDAGKSWSVSALVQAEGADKRFRTVVWLTDLQALAAGQGGLLYRSRDGGKNWEVLDSLPEKAKKATMHKMVFVDGVVWMVGERGLLLESKTNGTSWTIKWEGATDSAMRSIHFIDNFNGVATGDKGQAIITRNGGRTWEKLGGVQTFPDDDSLHTVVGNGESTFVILAKRNFWISKNRGGFWRSNGIFLSELPEKHSMTGGFFTSTKEMFITSTYGVLLKGELK